MNRIFFFLALLTGLSSASVAQQSSNTGRTISGIFVGKSFTEFAETVSASTPYQFYFDAEELTDIRVNLSLENSNLRDVLFAIFEKTDFKYSIDERDRVFITKGRNLTLRLSPTFFLENSQQGTAAGLSDGDRTFSKNKLYVIGDAKSNTGTATLKGKVVGYDTGNPVPGAVIYEQSKTISTVTDSNGNFNITLPIGRHTLFVQNLGGFVEQRQVQLNADGQLDLMIEENIISMDEFLLLAEKNNNIGRTEMGVQKLDMSSIKKIPAALGEVDVIRGVLSLPGVQTVGEASVGFNVRGGAADQNLILYNHATVYNPSHLFGLFSAFNADLVNGVELYKAGVPAQYGGRLSSVLDVNGSYGNAEKIKVNGGIGLLTGRLSVDGPIGKKTTLASGLRSTYSDWLLNLLEENTSFSNGRANFYDFNFNLAHQLTNKHALRLNVYASKDSFQFDADTLFGYENLNYNGSWTYFINERLESELVVGQDEYNFGIEGRDTPSTAYNLGYRIRQKFVRLNFKQEVGFRHKFTYGLSSQEYNLNAGQLDPFGNESGILARKVNPERALESAIYVSDDIEINDKLNLSLGLRYALYNYLGPSTARFYQAGESPSENTFLREERFASGEVIQSYQGPEFRLGARYLLDNTASIKFGYNTNRQFIHLLTNNAAIAPTDTWKLSDNNIAPQWGDQLSLGYYKNFKRDTYEFSAEVYHRNMKNLLDYRSGATLLLNDQVEQEILRTEGRSYGMELMLRKNSGKLNGWISYFYARSLLRTAADEQAEKINNGDWYPNNFDQPHNVTVMGNYELSKRVSTSLNFNYNTGRPITLPVAKFEYAGSERIFFSERNAYRIPDYFRMDFSINLEGNHKVRKLAHSSWSLGVYNVLGRQNPYSVFFTPVNGVLQGYQLSIFARPIPFITYNFRI
ncbi:TonB-dependent receptor [Belliella pelovolcani]|uniref:Outer membrane receptor proteins, mostly Fe transport n=1 Tax=Belliella pelovolcani TaxID=529505 RepID=A0A1N7K105_9BACT|nr:TonB-dependent receptor [Belliella pelovolcani]SIS55283.1 Outer membrane receptor proteins, mostly Fe transport [Belliella pelovolcani]